MAGAKKEFRLRKPANGTTEVRAVDGEHLKLLLRDAPHPTRYLCGLAVAKAADWAVEIHEASLADFRSPVAAFDDGDTAKVACWVRRIDAQQFQVFAINCAHLGCPVRWFAQSKLFLCPCHGGAYYEDGARASGPPERGLFEYRYKIAGNSLVIHAGDMPTLATQASCGEKPLIQIQPVIISTQPEETTSWQV